MLIVVVVGDGYRDGAGLRGAFQRSERRAYYLPRFEIVTTVLAVPTLPPSAT